LHNHDPTDWRSMSYELFFVYEGELHFPGDGCRSSSGVRVIWGMPKIEMEAREAVIKN